jgi:hypothetical protein
VPFEAIACARCGSIDVQEVKPSTYFCNHCESVFKYIDPSRLKVEHSPSFCWCGNAIQVQCQLCKKGICWQCDVSTNRDAIYRSPGNQAGYKADCGRMRLYGPGVEPGFFYYASYSRLEENTLPVPVNGFGYLHRDMDRRACGPFLYLSELLSSIAVARGLHYERGSVPVTHLCFACVADAVPVTVERIANHEICESPGCTDRPSETCRCCSSPFCANCVTPRADPNLRSYCGGRSLHGGRDGARDLFRPIFCTIFTREVLFPRPEGLCLPCLAEAIDKASGLAKQICEQEYRLLPGNPPHYMPDLVQEKDTIAHYKVAEIAVTGKKARWAELARQSETSERVHSSLKERAGVKRGFGLRFRGGRVFAGRAELARGSAFLRGGARFRASGLAGSRTGRSPAAGGGAGGVLDAGAREPMIVACGERAP